MSMTSRYCSFDRDNGIMEAFCGEPHISYVEPECSIDETMEKFTAEFHAQLDDMRQQGLFCDVVINFPEEGKKVYAHRAVLASSSLYFRALFTTNLKEAGQAAIEIPGIRHTDMEAIVRYSYTRKAELSAENIENVVLAADRLHVFGLVKVCCDFLREHIGIYNVLGIMRLANYLHCNRLAQDAWQYVMTHITLVSASSSEFKSLSVDELCQILESDDLNFHEEDEAVEVILSWVMFDHLSRRRHFHRLLSSIRLGLVRVKVFQDYLLKNEDILRFPECVALIQKGYRLSEINQQCRSPFLQGTSNPLLRPRVPHNVIFVLGGWCRDGVCGVLETYDGRADRWYRNLKLTFEQNIAYHALVAQEHFIYVIGGYTATRYLNTTKRFDCHEKSWTEVAPMHAKRCYVCAAAIGKRIYACGGFDGYVRHSSAEYYNPHRNQWNAIASMRHVRSDAGACSVGGKLYVCGGFNGTECLDTAEAYDPSHDQWTEIERLSCPRSGVALVKYNSSVYALGGFSGTRRLKSVERYVPRLEQWVPVADMQTSRSNFAATVCDGLLFAVGGYDGSSTTDHVECYDIYENEWLAVAGLLTGRSATAACTVKGLRNAKDYTYYGKDPKFVCSNIRNY